MALGNEGCSEVVLEIKGCTEVTLESDLCFEVALANELYFEVALAIEVYFGEDEEGVYGTGWLCSVVHLLSSRGSSKCSFLKYWSRDQTNLINF